MSGLNCIKVFEGWILDKVLSLEGVLVFMVIVK